MEILSTFHAIVEDISVLKIQKCHSNQWDEKTLNHPFFQWGCGPPSNAPIPRSTPLTIPNGIQIQIAVFHSSPTGQTDRQTDRPTDAIGNKPVPMPVDLGRNVMLVPAYTRACAIVRAPSARDDTATIVCTCTRAWLAIPADTELGMYRRYQTTLDIPV